METLYGSIANESNPAAWCDVSNVGLKQSEYDGSLHILHSLKVVCLIPSLHDYVYQYTSVTYCMIHEPRYLGTSLIPY